jgi:non-ribosomal peptide synthetase component F
MAASNSRDRKMTVADLLAAALSMQPAGPALQVGGNSYTYRDLRQRAIDYQQFASRSGIYPDDRVLFLGGPGLDLYACLLAGVLGSYTVSLAGALLSAQARGNLVRRLNPRLIIMEPGAFPPPDGYTCAYPAQIRDASRADLDLAGTSRAYLSLTSGTAGPPTLALVDARGLGGFCQWATGEIGVTRSDRWFEGADPSADLAITNALVAFSSGACLVVPAQGQRLRLAALAAMHGTTIMRVVPSVGSLMAAQAERRQAPIPGLRVLAFGGDELPGGLAARMLRAFHSSARTLNTYGMTESAGFLLFHWFDARQMSAEPSGGSVPLGRPAPGVRAWIDHSGQHRPGQYPATEGELDGIGELVVRANTVALEIEADGAPGNAVRKPEAGAEGELRTGDLVRKEGDNFIFLGRADRVVKIHGIRVNLARLDQLASGLLETNVCMLKHGDKLVALVESDRQISLNEVIRHTAGALHGPLVPRQIITVPELPRTRSGKISISACAEITRRALR